VITALLWIDREGKHLIIREPSLSSDTLRHAVERWGRNNGLERSISTGALIVAALHRKVPMRRLYGTADCLLAFIKAGLRRKMD
jgi:hypothetical protein